VKRDWSNVATLGLSARLSPNPKNVLIEVNVLCLELEQLALTNTCVGANHKGVGQVLAVKHVNRDKSHAGDLIFGVAGEPVLALLQPINVWPSDIVFLGF